MRLSFNTGLRSLPSTLSIVPGGGGDGSGLLELSERGESGESGDNNGLSEEGRVLETCRDSSGVSGEVLE